MRDLPVADPGEPDQRSASRFLWWLVRCEAPTIAAGVAIAVVCQAAGALTPAAIGRAIDAGLTHRNPTALLDWTLVVLALGITAAITNVVRHRYAVFLWLSAAYRVVQLTARQATQLGSTLTRRVAVGEVVSVGTSDIEHIGGSMDILLRGTASVVTIVLVTVILLTTSVPLGLVVVLGVPTLMALVGLLLRPYHRRQRIYRELQGTLANRASDIVAGLRVLRGIGGEPVFANLYRADSERLRDAGVGVARVRSVLEAAQVLLPGLFTALVTWLGARFALAGHITVGQLVAFYGYATFLITPLHTLVEAADRLARGHVAARRVMHVLTMRPDQADPQVPKTPPAAGAELHDLTSGLRVPSGALTAIAANDPAEAAAIAYRMGRYVDGSVTLGSVPLRDLALATVRERILVADDDTRLFSGRLRDELDPFGRATDAEVAAAIGSADAEDIVAALPAGLDTEIRERGRDFSGGQQQRLRLARALLADPEILILVQPTSAVDAHTEARIARRLATARAGRTTVVCTTSPLVLTVCDRVAFVSGGTVVAIGKHRELLATSPEYAAIVTRE